MNTSSDIVHYPNRQAYLEGRGVSPSDEATTSAKADKTASGKGQNSKKSEKAKPETKKSSPEKNQTKSQKPQKPKVSEKPDDVGEAAEKLGEQAVDQAKQTATTATMTPMKMAAKQLSEAVGGALNLPSQGAAERVRESDEIKNLKEKFEKSGAKVFFIRGFDWWGMGSDGGLKEMANELPESSYHSWKEEQQIVNEIKKLKPDSPVALIGHSLGGDAAVRVAEKLNKLESGYRGIDLLVTMDSVGFDNDIIPQNVKKNMNFIAENDGLLNDGPNMARHQKSTEVTNELRPEGHLGVDDSPELKRKIFQGVHKLVNSRAQQLLENSGKASGNPG